MKLYSKQQMSESFLIGTLLAVVGGFLDAYTYIARGGVFANAQTGNIVLMGMNLAEGRWLDAFACFIPIFAFVCGVFVDEWIRKFFLPKPVIHWRQIVILSEMLLLFIVAFLPLGGKYDLVANVLVSFVCSLQAQSFRKLHGLPYATTMCTGNLRSGTEHLFCFSQNKNIAECKKAASYYGVILFFIFGAGIGAVLAKQFGQLSVAFGNILLLLVCILLSIRSKENAE